MRTRLLGKVALLTLIGLAAAWHATGQGAELLTAAAGVEMSVAFGFDGLFRPGYWTPVRVTVTNHGTPMEAAVHVVTRHGSPIASLSHTTAYAQKLYLPTDVPIAVEVYALLSNAFHPLRVELRDAQGRVLAMTTLDVQRSAIDGAIVVAFDPGGSAWSWLAEQLGSVVTLRGQRAGVHVAYVRSPQEVPSSWLAYHAVTAVAVSGSFPLGALSEAQQQALARWIEAGGTVIWAGGFRTDAARSPLFATHSPVRPTGLIRRVPAALGPAYPPVSGGLDLVVWDGVPAEGSLLVQSEGVPLVARRRIGRGNAFYIAFDPHALGQAGWTGLGQLARDAFAAAGTLPADLGEAARAGWDYVRSAQLPQPPRAWPVLLSLGHILTLAAAVLALRRRRPTIPALLCAAAGVAALFSLVSQRALAPVAARSQHGVSELVITTADADGYGLRWILHGLRSRTAGQWVAHAAPDGWTQEPLALISGTATEPAAVIDRSGAAPRAELAAGAFGRFKAVEPARLMVAASLQLRDGAYHLKVANGTGRPISHLYYVYPGAYAYLGPAAPGETVAHSFPAGVRTGRSPAPEFIGEAVANDIRRRGASLARLADLIGALVAQRVRSGPSGNHLDDGFLIGVIEAPPEVTFAPEPNMTTTHVFLLDVRL